jgi:hypothetical protein
MPDWAQLDPQLRQFAAEGVNPTAMAKRLTLARQTVVDRLRKLGLKASRPSPPTTVPPQEAPIRIEFPPRPEGVAEERPGQVGLGDADTPADAVSGIADMAPVIMGDALSSDETQILAHYEEVIERGIKTFVEVGRALMAIRDRQLYRATSATFEAYCRERWDLSRPYAYQLIDAAVVVENLSGITDIVPVNEAQAQPLTRLPPEEQMEVWVEVVKTAPTSGVTAKHVKTTISRVKGQTTGATQAKPAATAPAPRRPPRLVVQEGLVWGLREVADGDAWDILGTLWDDLHALAPKYESLRGMLDRVKRQFPDGYGPVSANV